MAFVVVLAVFVILLSPSKADRDTVVEGEIDCGVIVDPFVGYVDLTVGTLITEPKANATEKEETEEQWWQTQKKKRSKYTMMPLSNLKSGNAIREPIG